MSDGGASSRRIWLAAAIGWLGVIAISCALPSMINSAHPLGPMREWPRAIASAVELHANWGPFAKRPIMNGALILLDRATGWSAWTRFVIAQVAALAWATVELVLTASRVARGRGDADGGRAATLRALALWFTFPPVLFAWFAPVYTFDDLVVAAAVLRAVRGILDRDLPRAALWLAVAAIGHEIAVFALPGLAWLAWDELRASAQSRGRRIAGVAALLVVPPAAAWFVQRVVMHGEDMTDRLVSLTVNFADRAAILSTIGSIVLALGLPALLAWTARDATTAPRRLARYHLAIFGVALPVVAIATFVREFRLLALAGYVAIPFLGPALRRGAFALFDRLQIAVALAIGGAAAIAYPPALASCAWAFRVYAGALVGLAAAQLAAVARRRPRVL